MKVVHQVDIDIYENRKLLYFSARVMYPEPQSVWSKWKAYCIDDDITNDEVSQQEKMFRASARDFLKKQLIRMDKHD